MKVNKRLNIDSAHCHISCEKAARKCASVLHKLSGRYASSEVE